MKKNSFDNLPSFVQNYKFILTVQRDIEAFIKIYKTFNVGHNEIVDMNGKIQSLLTLNGQIDFPTERQIVTVTLQIFIPYGYPAKQPIVQVIPDKGQFNCQALYLNPNGFTNDIPWEATNDILYRIDQQLLIFSTEPPIMTILI